MDNVSVEDNDRVVKSDHTLAFDNRAFEGADQIDRKEMESSTTSTIIGDERSENQLLDSFISTTEDDGQHYSADQNILPAKFSIEAILCENAESSRKAESDRPVRGDSSEISDEELVEYPKCKEIKSTKQQILKVSQTNEDLMCTSPASQTDVHLTSSGSAQTIPTSGSGEYITCKSGVNSSVTSAASYLTAHDSTFHSKTLSVSNSDSTLSSDSGTLIEERDTEQQDQDYEELFDIETIKKFDLIEQQAIDSRVSDLKDEEDDDDSSSTELLTHTIISSSFKEPYDTEIPKSVICDSTSSESFIKVHTIEQQQQEFHQGFQPKQLSVDSSKLATRLSLSEQSDTSIETAIYKGNADQSDFSSLESNSDDPNSREHIRDEQMPNIMKSNNLEWDSNLDDEMIIHHEYADLKTETTTGSKKSSIDLYTLEEEEESRTEDALSVCNKLAVAKDLKDLKTQLSSADNSSSLMEFERLEKEVDQGDSDKNERVRHSSLDSIGSIGSTGVLGTPKLISNAQQSDNTSVSSLNEFERLENELLSEEQLEQQQIKKQLTEIEEGHESQASDSAETMSGNSQIRMEREDDSEIELELNAKLDDYASCSATTTQQVVEDLEATPKYVPQQALSISKTEEEYDEEVLKIVKTTENRIIEEIPSGKFKDT